MSLTRSLALIRKELRHIIRDPQLLFMVLVAPAFVLFLLAYTFAADLETVRMGVMDRDRSAISRDYIRALLSDGKLQVVGMPDNYVQAEAMLRRGEANLVIVIPPDWSDALAAGQETRVQLILDGSDYLQSQTYIRNLTLRTTSYSTLLAAGMNMGVSPIDVRTRALYNPALTWIDAMIPGLMAMSFSFPAIGAALACTRETEHGSYEGLLSTPIRPAEYLMGKLLPYWVIGTLGTLPSWALAIGWFGVPFRGTLFDYVILAGTFMLALVSIALLVGVTMASQRHAIVIVIFIFFIPSFFLSNLLLPLEPGSFMERVLMSVLPATNYVDMNRAVFLKGAGAFELSYYILNLLRISGVALIASLLFSRKKVA